MASKRQLKTKIQAIGNIQQMTKAMQMVAAAKMRRAQESALAARPYAKKAFELQQRLKRYAELHERESRFLQQRSTGKACLVVLTSDKGMAGSYNSQVLKAALRWKEEQALSVDVAAVGRKARDFFAVRGGVAAEFLKFSDVAVLADAAPVAGWILDSMEAYERVAVCSTQFVSALHQEVRVQQILPLEESALARIIESIVPKTGRYADIAGSESAEELERPFEYFMEPGSAEVLDRLFEDLVRVAVFHLVLESNASEHSSRMVAMKSAAENAEDIRTGLVLDLNKARQAGITQELAEIASAKEALSA